MSSDESCDHDYRRVGYERVRTRSQDPSIDDEDLTRSELIDRANDEQPAIVTYRCTHCGDEYEEDV